MATQVEKAVSLGNDVVRVDGLVNGQEVSAFGWLSALQGLTPAQKLAYAKGLLNAAAPRAETDLGISG